MEKKIIAYMSALNVYATVNTWQLESLSHVDYISYLIQV